MSIKERLLSGDYQPGTYLLYETTPLGTYNIRISVKMRDMVDGKVLAAAANRAIKRYPYFAIRLESDGGKKYVIKPNALPIVVMRTQNPPPALGSEAVNYHLNSIDYIGKMVYFNLNHSFAGGCGSIPWVKSVLYEYVTEKYNVSLDSTDINLPDSVLEDDEMAFPIPDELPDVEPFGMYRGQSGYFLGQDYMSFYKNPDHSGDGYYCLKIDQHELVKYVRANDASPATIFSVLMFKALSRVLPEEAQVITCGVASNYRDQVDCPNTALDLTRALHIKYTRNMADMPVDRLCTMTRGMVMLQNQPENSIIEFKNLVKYHEKIDSFGTIKEKREFCQKAGRWVEGARDTYNVSYVGNTDFGSLGEYVKAIYSHTNGHLLLEVNSMNNMFFISFHQYINKIEYLNAFLDVMEEEGIRYTISGLFPRNLPALVLPE